MKRLIIDIPESEYNNVLQYATKKGGKVKAEEKPESKAMKAAKELDNMVNPGKKPTMQEIVDECHIVRKAVK